MSIFCRIDDKLIPLYRVLWVAATPHFCGESECNCEGLYEITLDGGSEPIWARHDEKERLIEQIEAAYPADQAENLTRKLLNAIRSKDATKFTRTVRRSD